MPSEQQLERSVLERKEREELRAIAQAMSLATTSRSKKADIIDLILRAAGVEVADAATAKSNGSAEGRKVRKTAASSSDPKVESGSGTLVETAIDTPSVADAGKNGAAKNGSAVSSNSSNGTGADHPAQSNDQPGDSSEVASADPAAVSATTITSAGTAGGTSAGTAGGIEDRTDNRQQASRPAGQQPRQGGPAESGTRRSRRRRGRERPERVGGEQQQQRSGSERELQAGGQEGQYQGELVTVNGLFDLRDEG
jgi:hypothetical protein